MFFHFYKYNHISYDLHFAMYVIYYSSFFSYFQVRRITI